jgi:photosystem II stability/assembly factor-like uncharacterized protein
MLKKYLPFFFICFFTAFSYSQCSGDVQLLNAAVQKSLFFDPLHGVAFGHGTMIKTTDGGNTWNFQPSPTAGFYEDAFRVGQILNSTTAIIAGAKGTVIRTTDKGATWNNVTLPIPMANVHSMHFINDNTGFMTGYTYSPLHKYLFKTTNGGLTWQASTLNIDWDSPWAYDIFFLNSTTGYAWAENNFYKTTNGGTTWVLKPYPTGTESNPARITMMKKASDGTLIISATASYGKFYKSTNSGTTWTEIAALSTTSQFYASYPYFDIVGTKIVTLGIVGSGIDNSFCSYNYATNQFTSIPFNIKVGNPSSVFFVDATTGYINERGFTYWADTPGQMILKTTDGGTTWHKLDDLSIYNPGSAQLNIKKNGIGTYTMSKQDGYNFDSDFSIYTSTNDGASWHLRRTEENLHATLMRAKNGYISYLRFTDPLNGAMGFSLYESYDYGLAWQSTSFFTPPEVYNLKQTDDNTLMSYSGAAIYISHDKGLQWTEIHPPVIPNVVFYESYYRSSTEIYTWGTYDNWPEQYEYYLYRSTNNGASWEQVVMIPDNAGADLGVTAATTIFGSDFALVSTGGNTYFKVDLNTNTYQSWAFNTPQSSLVYINDDYFTLLDDHDWLMHNYNDGKPYRSTDQGLSWQQIDCAVCGVNILFEPSSKEIITYNSDHGAERIQRLLPTAPIINGDAVSVVNQNYVYHVNPAIIANFEWILPSAAQLVANNGNEITVKWLQEGTYPIQLILHNECGESEASTLNVTVTSVLSVDDNISAAVKIAPNPFNDSIVIETPFQEESTVTLYNMTGQRIAQSQTINGKATINSMDSLPRGMYFLKIFNPFYQEVRKMVKE